jgi:chitinase
MKKFFLFPLAIISLVTFNSCKKDDETEVENKKPTVNFTNPEGDLVISGTNVDLNVTVNASDADGTISKVSFYVNGTYIFDDETAPYSMSSNFGLGTVVLKAVATDNEGAKGESTKTIEISQE